MEAAVAAILGKDALSEEAKYALRLPVASGGLGIRSVQSVAIAAYAAARAEERGETFVTQKDATKKIDAAILAEYRSKVLSTKPNGEKLRQAAAASKLMSVPVYPNSVVGFRQYARERLGLPLTAPNTVCVCGKLATNDHLRTCGAKNYLRIRRHDRIKLLLGREARKRFPTKVEPHGTDPESREHPDLCIFRDGVEFHVDVAVVYSGRTDCSDPLHSMATAKIAKYKNLNLLPFVVGTSGEFENNCQSVFNLICTSAGERQVLQQSIYEVLLRENAELVTALTSSTLNNFIPPVEEGAVEVDECEQSLYSCNEELEEVDAEVE
jgi:hypothetical protein